MATCQMNVPLAGKSQKEVYTAALTALPAAGFNIWKTREIACLVMGKSKTPAGEVDCNVMALPGMGASLSLAGDGVDAADLQALADQVAAALRASLS